MNNWLTFSVRLLILLILIKLPNLQLILGKLKSTFPIIFYSNIINTITKVTVTNHMIMYHTERYKRFWNNNIISYINNI